MALQRKYRGYTLQETNGEQVAVALDGVLLRYFNTMRAAKNWVDETVDTNAFNDLKRRMNAAEQATEQIDRLNTRLNTLEQQHARLYDMVQEHAGFIKHGVNFNVIGAEPGVYGSPSTVVERVMCPMCGQRIDDGRPCGCGARPVDPGYSWMVDLDGMMRIAAVARRLQGILITEGQMRDAAQLLQGVIAMANSRTG